MLSSLFISPDIFLFDKNKEGDSNLDARKEDEFTASTN